MEVQHYSANLCPGSKFELVRVLRRRSDANFHQLVRLIRMRPIMLALDGKERFQRFFLLWFDRARQRLLEGEVQSLLIGLDLGRKQSRRKYTRGLRKGRIV